MLMILVGSIHTMKKNTEVLIPDRREIVAGVNPEKTKYTAI